MKARNANLTIRNFVAIIDSTISKVNSDFANMTEYGKLTAWSIINSVRTSLPVDQHVNLTAAINTAEALCVVNHARTALTLLRAAFVHHLEVQ